MNIQRWDIAELSIKGVEEYLDMDRATVYEKSKISHSSRWIRPVASQRKQSDDAAHDGVESAQSRSANWPPESTHLVRERGWTLKNQNIPEDKTQTPAHWLLGVSSLQFRRQAPASSLELLR